MSEFKINHERQKVFIEEERPADGLYHAGDFQELVAEFASTHAVPESAVRIPECGKTTTVETK